MKVSLGRVIMKVSPEMLDGKYLVHLSCDFVREVIVLPGTHDTQLAAGHDIAAISN